jgi:cell volume regulation protein A
MFVMMGLLVFPSRLLEIAPLALPLAFFLTLVARPLVVWLCLLPFRYPRHEVAYIAWVGLRGAVPIVLATYPLLAGASGAGRVFDIVFFVVVVSAIVPGATVSWLTRRLRLESAEPPAPQAVLEVESMQPLDGELLSFYVDEALPVAGVRLDEIPLPERSAITMIVRGRELVAPRPATVIQPGDHVYVFARDEDRAVIQLMMGRPEV